MQNIKKVTEKNFEIKKMCFFFAGFISGSHEFTLYFCLVTYLDFLHARIIHDSTSDKKKYRKSYLVQFSVNYKTQFPEESLVLLDNFLSYSLRS